MPARHRWIQAPPSSQATTYGHRGPTVRCSPPAGREGPPSGCHLLQELGESAGRHSLHAPWEPPGFMSLQNGQMEPAAYESNAAAALGRGTARFIFSSAKGSRVVVSSFTAGSKDSSTCVRDHRSWELHAPDAHVPWALLKQEALSQRVESRSGRGGRG